MECVENVQGNLLVYTAAVRDVYALLWLGLSEERLHQFEGPLVITGHKEMP